VYLFVRLGGTVRWVALENPRADFSSPTSLSRADGALQRRVRAATQRRRVARARVRFEQQGEDRIGDRAHEASPGKGPACGWPSWRAKAHSGGVVTTGATDRLTGSRSIAPNGYPKPMTTLRASSRSRRRTG
jgi:hypothetical protein